MKKDSDWLCPNCEIVPKYESITVSFPSKNQPALRTTCDMCGGIYLIIEETTPKLSSFEANLKFQDIEIVQKEDGRRRKKKK